MEPSVETFVQEALAGAAQAFGLGFSVVFKPRTVAGRPVLKATLLPPPGSPLTSRRWAQLASGLQALVEAALLLKGEAGTTVEVGLLESPAVTGAGTPAEAEEELGLVRAARTMAQRAVALQRPFALGPMSAVERRLVHQALGDVPEVWTQSEGDGIFRRLWVVPRHMMPGRSASGKAARAEEPVATPASGSPPDASQP